MIGDKEVPYQLSVFASSVDYYRRLEEGGLRPGVVAGHSLGEYAAAFAAGAFALEDGAWLVAERDRFMRQAAEESPGRMIAIIGADAWQVAEAVEAVEGTVVVANFNTPRQTVISGEEAALEEAAGLVVSGRKRGLDVAGAFHSPLMQQASLEMDALLSQVHLEDPEIPLVSGLDGSVLERADDVRLALRNQMLSPVRWVAVVERFASLGIEEMVEAGGGTLVRMLRDFKDVEIKGWTAGEVL